MSKILFVDIDGTLVDDQRNLSKKNLDAINDFKERGGHFVISTGRPPGAARAVFKQLNHFNPGDYAVCFNGGMIYDCHKQEAIHKEEVPYNLIEETFALAASENFYCQTYLDGEVLLGSQPGKCVEYYTSTTDFPNYRTGAHIYEDLEGRSSQKCLMISLDEPERLEAFRVKYEPFFNERKLSIFFSTPYYLEVVPYGVSKAKGNEKLAEILGVNREDTIACGDERNDIEMIQAAGIGVAMKNALDVVKAAADYITINDNNHDGIAEVIKKFTF